MRKLTLPILFCLLIGNTGIAQEKNTEFVTSDIDRFWMAYDKITTTKDSALQYDYLDRLFIEKGTPGLKAIMQARQYTAKSYIDAINQYPLFWNSIRANTFKAKTFADEIAANVLSLKQLYPGLKPAKVYFTIGALRTGGTTLNGTVLIGSEIAMADKNTVTQEFPEFFNHLKTYFKTDPVNIVVFTNIHEYVHTQQKTTLANYLLPQAVLEGVAEFLAEKATRQSSALPALGYGKTHDERIRSVFALQMFKTSNGFWLYSNTENEFGQRDLGYYVGYAICEKYYGHAKDKKQAIKEMIELDYNDEAALGRFVDESGYFAKPVQALKNEYEAKRPVVTGITQLKNNALDVDPSITRISIIFSEPMDTHHRNFELGPLGETNLLKLKRFIGFSEDGRSVTFEIELKPNQHYQVIVGDGFRNKDAFPLKPYLVDFTTANK